MELLGGKIRIYYKKNRSDQTPPENISRCKALKLIKQGKARILDSVSIIVMQDS